ncbi:MAG: sensor histidine kinase [Actinomycetota bacterium]
MPNSRFDRSFRIDALMALVLFAASIMSYAGFPEIESFRPTDVWSLVLVASQTLTLAWRRRYPIAVLVVVGLGFAIERGFNYPQSWAYFGIAFALYTIGAELPMRKSRIVAGVTILLSGAWTAVGTFVYDIPVVAVMGVVLYLAFPWLIGVESRRREQRALDLEARAIRAEMAREQDAANAVRDERSRIARELHDVVAHEMTVMTVQASAAERVVESDPEAALVAMQNVQEAGHRGLAEMRRMLGVLRKSDGGSLEPQPGLEGLERLVQSVTNAGLPVTVTVEGEPRPLPPGVDVNAYRIIQESLTNSARHGGPGTVADVIVSFNDGKLGIDVLDDGRGAATNMDSPESGHGLVGMSERIALLDGTIAAGPRRGGGYRVHASIPIPSQ